MDNQLKIISGAFRNCDANRDKIIQQYSWIIMRKILYSVESRYSTNLSMLKNIYDCIWATMKLPIVIPFLEMIEWLDLMSLLCTMINRLVHSGMINCSKTIKILQPDIIKVSLPTTSRVKTNFFQLWNFVNNT